MNRTRSLLYVAAGVRAAVIALSAIVLGLHLAEVGTTPRTIGFVVAVGMTANALSAAFVAWRGVRAQQRAVLICLAAAAGIGLIILGVAHDPLLIAAAAFIGMVNGMGRDRGGAQAIEQAILASNSTDASRTTAFVRYTVAQDIGAAAGSLAVGLVASARHPGAGVASHTMLTVAGIIMLASLLFYLPVQNGAVQRTAERLSRATRRRLAGLSSLFALDSIGGGFLAGTLITYWFFERFAISAATIGVMFFSARVLNTASYFAADWLARRIGLLRTMVFTHLPTSVILFLLPFARTSTLAIALFLTREAFVQMDVPARQSYLAAVVAPHERAAALGATNVVRYAGWAVGPALAGFTMSRWGLSAPLFIGAVLKAAYDIALYFSFHSVATPEELSAG